MIALLREFVARALVARAYPLRRPDVVMAPGRAWAGRVDARVEPAHDDGNVVAAKGSHHTVTRALVARAYPLRRPDIAAAPGRVDARVKPAHDDGKVAHDDKTRTRDDGKVADA